MDKCLSTPIISNVCHDKNSHMIIMIKDSNICYANVYNPIYAILRRPNNHYTMFPKGVGVCSLTIETSLTHISRVSLINNVFDVMIEVL